MAMNRIQFQPGLSMPEFLKDFGTEAQCEQALEAVRWPTGFHCPRCDGAAHYVVRDGSRKVFQCQACRHQASLIAGTVLQGSKLPLTIWFLAIYLISQAKTGLSALALKQVRYFWKQAHWLQEKFPVAELRDVPGLVKLVSIAEIAANDWSLTPGRYVGVATEESDEDFDFEQALRDIHVELQGLNEEARELAARIARNFEELGI